MKKNGLFVLVGLISVLTLVSIVWANSVDWKVLARFDDNFHTDLFCNCTEYNNYIAEIAKHKATDNSGSSSDGQNGESNTSKHGNSGSSSDYKCGYCGKMFSGNIYTHAGKMADCHTTTNPSAALGKFCSSECCSMARMKSCPSCYK